MVEVCCDGVLYVVYGCASRVVLKPYCVELYVVHVGEICASKQSYMCLRYLMLTLSGPVELLFPCFIATWTCVVVSVMLIVCSLCVFLSMFVECVCYQCG